MEDVLKQSSNFIAACYSVTGEQITMSFVRQKVWSSHVGKASSCAQELCSLPPTSKPFCLLVSGNKQQSWIILNEPFDYGWENNEATKSFNPVMVPKNIKLAPPEELQLIKCSSGSESACGT